MARVKPQEARSLKPSDLQLLCLCVKVHLGVALTGLLMGLGSSPTHEAKSANNAKPKSGGRRKMTATEMTMTPTAVREAPRTTVFAPAPGDPAFPDVGDPTKPEFEEKL